MSYICPCSTLDHCCVLQLQMHCFMLALYLKPLSSSTVTEPLRAMAAVHLAVKRLSCLPGQWHHQPSELIVTDHSFQQDCHNYSDSCRRSSLYLSHCHCTRCLWIMLPYLLLLPFLLVALSHVCPYLIFLHCLVDAAIWAVQMAANPPALSSSLGVRFAPSLCLCLPA